MDIYWRCDMCGKMKSSSEIADLKFNSNVLFVGLDASAICKSCKEKIT